MNNKHKTIGLSALLGATAFLGSAQATQVIVNPGFDAPAAGNGTQTLIGWGSMHVYQHTYNGPEGIDLYTVTSDTIDDHFKGLGAASQTVDLTASLAASELTAIAAGNGSFDFGAWMSGWTGDNNTVATQLQFFSSTDGTGTALSTFTLDRGVTTNQINTAQKIGDPTDALGFNTTSESDPDYWGLYSLNGAIDPTAQSLTVSFVAGTGHVGGGANDWYADDVTVNITTVPEPSATALLGLGGLALIMRRRK